ncbi:hypothetical protein BST30_26130 [Mycobacterium mantenii]|uniref:Uncharacterized protein n=1 Tax=Mycobacterium mantenii TaxID=560555 RepID=A0A1X0F9N3_MYCNT|nr:hypothetical protein BST30_26130 [Mycobacterium mantenii]
MHSWLARYEASGLEELVARSHRPVRCPHQMPAAVEAALLSCADRDPVEAHCMVKRCARSRSSGVRLPCFAVRVNRVAIDRALDCPGSWLSVAVERFAPRALSEAAQNPPSSTVAWLMSAETP